MLPGEEGWMDEVQKRDPMIPFCPVKEFISKSFVWDMCLGAQTISHFMQEIQKVPSVVTERFNWYIMVTPNAYSLYAIMNTPEDVTIKLGKRAQEP